MKKEKKNYLSKRLAVIITIGLNTLILNAQEADTMITQELNEVIISATRSEKKVDEIGKSITVITADDLKNCNYNNVSDLLSQQEGFSIIGTGQNPGALQGLYLRGSNTKHTSIYIDGVRVTDPSSPDNAVDLSELSLINIERIEIVRGTQSTLYGSSTIGGTINIITKKNSEKGFHITTEAKAGVFGKSTSLFSENIFLNYTTKNGFYLNGEVVNLNTKGLDATTDTVTLSSTYNNRDKDNFKKTDIVGKVGFKNKKYDIYGSYKIATQVADIDDGAYRDDDNNTLEFNRNTISYGVTYKLSDNLNFTFSGGYSNMSRLNIDDSSVVDFSGITDKSYFKSNYTGNILNNELQSNLKFDKTDYVIGIGQYTEKMNIETDYYNEQWGPYLLQNNLDSLNIQSSINNIFLHANLKGELINEKWKGFNLALGGRYNNHSAFGNNFTYEINPSYKTPHNGLIYLLYSTGFNAPSLYQLYTPEKNYISNTSRGNNKLTPENAITIEAGLKQKINKNIYFSAALFNTIIHNTIEYVYLWDKNIGIDTLGNDWMRDDFRGDTYINIGKQITQGIEINASVKLNDKLTVKTNISILNGKLYFNPDFTDTSITQGHHVQLYNNGAFLNKNIEAQGLTRRPNIANVSLTYNLTKKLTLSTDVRYVSTKEDIFYDAMLGPYGALNTSKVSEYALCDIGAKYKFNKKLFAAMRAENIFNTKYEEIKGYNTRGRGFYLNVNYSF